MGELRAKAAVIRHASRPPHDEWVARAAEMGADLLAPLERRVARPRPGRAVVGIHDLGAPLIEAAVALGQLQLHLVGERDAVLHRELVERAGDRALHAGAVVTPDPQDQRVVELAELLDRVKHPADVVVGVLGVARVDLHLARIERLERVGDVVPRRECRVARREFCVGRDHAKLLLSGERLLAERVPALIELPLVLVGPSLRDVVRRVAAAGRVVDEERLLRVLRPNAVQPLDRLVGHRIGEVVRIVLVVIALVGPDDLLVLCQHRVPLARASAEDPVEVVEAPPAGPAVEGACVALLPVRRQMPLAERRGRITVVSKNPRQRRTVARQDRRVSREPTRELTDRSETDSVVVPAGQERGACRRAERRHVEPVVLEASVRHARVVRCLDRAPERARVPESCVVDQHEQHVGRTFRRRRMPNQVPIRLRPVERPVGRAGERLSSYRKTCAIGLTHQYPFSPASIASGATQERKSSGVRHCSPVPSWRGAPSMPPDPLPAQSSTEDRRRVWSASGAHTCVRIWQLERFSGSNESCSTHTGPAAVSPPPRRYLPRSLRRL